MAPPADEEKRGVRRMVDRGETRIARRSDRTAARAVLRLEERNGDHVLTRAPDNVEILARSSEDLPAHRVADMRSKLVRQVVQMAVLDAQKGLGRKSEVVQRSEAPDGGDKGKGASTVFQQWYAEMAAQGMTEREIEEHLAARVRAVRRGVALMYSERTVGRV